MSFLLTFIYYLCQVLTVLIFLRAIISWFPVNPYSPLVSLLYRLTEPVLAPLRRLIPRVGMVDITPMIAIVILQVVASVI